MTNAQRKALNLAGNTAAQGLQIFNTTTECVETWNGTKWIKQCGGNYVRMPVPTECSTTVPPVRFMTYNLGADPQYDTPKKQMKYLAETSYPKNGVTTLQLDATVNGGLFQWGRKDTLYAVDAVNFKRYDGTNHSAQLYDPVYNPTTGQIITNNTYDAKDMHVYTSGGNWYTNSAPDANTLWGNGVAVGTPTTPEGVQSTGGNYYQSTKWIHSENDPCPPGFRVPTQDEWERLGDYECQPNSAGGTLTDITVTGKHTGKGLTWVPVICTYSTGRCVPNNSWSTGNSSGYAIYEESVWTDATTTGVYAAWAVASPTTDTFNNQNGDGTYKYPSLHEEATAPEPLLFLPASGLRNDGSGAVGSTGNYGYYWSSTVNGTNAYSLGFNSSAVYPSFNNKRAGGFSIRCVVE
jgi:hypothetical protein